MTTLIRIEHPSDGRGLWISEDVKGGYKIDYATFFSDIVKKHRELRTPQEDGLIMTERHYCAFKNMEDLHKWVEIEWIKELSELGFKVLMIDVSKCEKGGHQAIFLKEDILQTKDITNLFL